MRYRNILFLIAILAVVLILTAVFQKSGARITIQGMLTASETGTSTEGNIGKGKIFRLSYLPEKPLISESLTITAGVENDGNEKYDYKLIIFIIKDGSIKETFEYPFTLESGRSVSFSPDYVPDDIGVFEIVAKLYDKYEITLIDSKIIKFSSISDIGPFDLSIDVLSKVVRPAESVPVILSLENMGEKGTDVEIRIGMDCLNQMNVEQSFFIFMEAKSSLDKKVSLSTCNEVGIHDITAKIILYNKTWISSMNQILLNNSYAEVLFKPLDTFKINAGESKIFDLSVKNFGNTKISNLKILIENIPLSWFKVTPALITELNPNETVLFLINFSIPADADSRNYSIKVDASTDKSLEKQDSTLEITSLAVYPVSEENEKGRSISLPIIPFITSNLTTILTVAGVGILVLLMFRFKDRISFRRGYRGYRYRERNVLERVKNAIERKKL